MIRLLLLVWCLAWTASCDRAPDVSSSRPRPDNRVLWSFKTQNGAPTNPALGQDKWVYVTDDSKVYALCRRTGALRWQTKAQPFLTSPVLGPDGLLFVAAGDDKLHALDTKTGLRRWVFESAYGFSSPAAVGPDGTVYIGMQDDRIRALASRDGSRQWEVPLTGVIHPPLPGPDSALFVASQDGNLHALSNRTGDRLWEYKTGGHPTSPVLDANGTLYLGDRTGVVHAVDAKTGQRRWIHATNPGQFGITTPPALLVDGTVVVGTWDNNVRCLRSNNGTLKWEFKSGGPVAFAPASDPQGTLYIGAGDGKVHALDSQTGNLKWTHGTSTLPVPGITTALILDPRGTLYLGTARHLHALNPNASQP